MQRDPHELAELRSLALHRAIAQAIVREPGLIATARERLRLRIGVTPPADSYGAAWLRWLALPPEKLARQIVRDDDEGRAMRQSTPFTFVVPARERWELWKRVRGRVNRHEAS